jgi:hypothetical protein
MLNFVENLLENERDPRSGPMSDQDHSLSLSDPDRSLVLSHFLTNFLENLALCQTRFREAVERHFADKLNEYFYNELKMLLKGCNTCILKQEAYIEIVYSITSL